MVRSVRRTRLEPCRPPSSFETAASPPPQDEGGAANAPPALFFAARAAPSLPFCPGKNRGSGAPSGAPNNPRLARRGVPLAKGTRLSALHRGDFGLRDRASGARTADSSPTLSRGFRRVRPAPSSHQRQSPVVGPDGYPRPPECVAANHARGRRTSRRRIYPVPAHSSRSAT
ncbi:MAG: hypothetical protein QOD75_340 [Blastocatellia bacterium]|nr:hypothetical protein [Blastocatellia bacterium]